MTPGLQVFKCLGKIEALQRVIKSDLQGMTSKIPEREGTNTRHLEAWARQIIEILGRERRSLFQNASIQSGIIPPTCSVSGVRPNTESYLPLFYLSDAPSARSTAVSGRATRPAVFAPSLSWRRLNRARPCLQFQLTQMISRY